MTPELLLRIAISVVGGSLLASIACADAKPVQPSNRVESPESGSGAKVDLANAKPAAPIDPNGTEKVVKTEDEWKAILTPEQFHVLREKGTERAFSGTYWNEHRKGLYRCAACGKPLFAADTKFDSGTGWPSFYQPVDKGAIADTDDSTFGMTRTEVTCSRCGGHLGHVFDDGPKPTGLRYCINSVSLKFEPAAE